MPKPTLIICQRRIRLKNSAEQANSLLRVVSPCHQTSMPCSPFPHLCECGTLILNVHGPQGRSTQSTGRRTLSARQADGSSDAVRNNNRSGLHTLDGNRSPGTMLTAAALPVKNKWRSRVTSQSRAGAAKCLFTSEVAEIAENNSNSPSLRSPRSLW